MSSELHPTDNSTFNTDHSELFDRIVSILEQARDNVVRSINHNTVLANWLIGREIVHELQGGESRAEYGKQILTILSQKLSERYGSGYSVPNLQNFRKFYLAFADRLEIQYPVGTELELQAKSYPMGTKSPALSNLSPSVRDSETIHFTFSPRLSWSHYRALMRVKDEKARDFYERESAECGWDKRDLERQIQTRYYERMLTSQNPQAMIEAGRREIAPMKSPIDMLKNPFVLEFLDLPDLPVLHESHLETAIIGQLSSFLLELGKGFAFVARQKRIQFEDKNLFVDLVFYNCVLKCYLLIDLKMGELTHADVGQMDGYVRLYDDQYTTEGDNPTIGLILCAEKNDAVAKYSVLSDRKQIFASKYMTYLPTEEQLVNEIRREMRLLENLKDEAENDAG